jgi:hypothetical protein
MQKDGIIAKRSSRNLNTIIFSKYIANRYHRIVISDVKYPSPTLHISGEKDEKGGVRIYSWTRTLFW